VLVETGGGIRLPGRSNLGAEENKGAGKMIVQPALEVRKQEVHKRVAESPEATYRAKEHEPRKPREMWLSRSEARATARLVSK